jgi:hypothetical protein
VERQGKIFEQLRNILYYRMGYGPIENAEEMRDYYRELYTNKHWQQIRYRSWAETQAYKPDTDSLASERYNTLMGKDAPFDSELFFPVMAKTYLITHNIQPLYRWQQRV